MGMFDSFYDKDGNEWQTKAYDCVLAEYRICDPLPPQWPRLYQVKVLGGIKSFATVFDDILLDVPAERDKTLPLLDYHGGWIEEGESN